MLALQAYESSDEDTNGETNNEENNESHLCDASKLVDSEYSVKKQLQVCAAPVVLPTVSKMYFNYYLVYTAWKY